MQLKHGAAMVLVVLVLVGASMLFRNVILDGVALTKLQAGPPLSGVLSQSLITSQSKNTLPGIGSDFKIQSTQYFDNQQWAVVTVEQISNGNGATLVLQKLDGEYQVVLGPGTSFSTDDVQLMPTDVIDYLTTQGLVDDAAN